MPRLKKRKKEMNILIGMTKKEEIAELQLDIIADEDTMMRIGDDSTKVFNHRLWTRL